MIDRDSDIVQETLQRTKLLMTQAGLTVSDDDVFEYLNNAVAAVNSTPKPNRQDGDGLLGWNTVSGARHEVKIRDYTDRLRYDIAADIEARVKGGGEDLYSVACDVVNRPMMKSLIAHVTSQPACDAAEGARLASDRFLSDFKEAMTTSPPSKPNAMSKALDVLIGLAFVSESNSNSASSFDDKLVWAAHARKIREAVSLISTAPAPAPDAMREALEALELAGDRFDQAERGIWADDARETAKRLSSAPVPPADGASKHGIQCTLCDETLHDNEICDDAECPIGGSFTVVPSATRAAEPVEDQDPPMRVVVSKALIENLVASVDVNGMPIISGFNSATSAVLALYATSSVRGDREAIAKWLWEYLYASKGFGFWPDVSEETRELWRSVASAFIAFLSLPVQPSDAKDKFYVILSQSIPQDMIDSIWQEIKEAGVFSNE